jgi:hypothetical protein
MEICKSFDCIKNADLSVVTKRTYLERLRYMIHDTKTDLYTILTNPKKYLDWIKNHSSSLQTQKSYISAILAVFKHTDDIKKTEQKHYYDWYQGFKEIHKQIDQKYKLNQPTEKQQQAYVPYADIVRKRDELEKGSRERLLLGMYTYLPPLRSDFNKIYIYEKKPSEYEHPNHIRLFDTPPKLILNEYKTVTKNDSFEKDLPPELVDEIKESLKKEPREWLFMDREKKPYKENSYNRWVNRTLQKLFKKPLTISLIRHSYINSLDFNKMTIVEKEMIAKDMAHTVNTQDRYRLIFN